MALIDDEDTLRPEVVRRILRTRSVVATDVGGASRQGARRDRNEDAWGFAAGNAFVVADGMGGREAGDLAASATVETLLSELQRPLTDWPAVLGTVNRSVQDAARRSGHESIGAVAVGLRCHRDRATIVHVGDARAYRLRSDGTQQLTRDHSVAEAIADLGLRQSESGLPAGQLAAVTSFFGGDRSADEYSVHELTVLDGDRIVLCTDGVHHELSPTDWHRASTISTAGDASAFLVDTAAQRGATDDCTALVIDLTFDAGPTDEHVSHRPGNR